MRRPPPPKPPEYEPAETFNPYGLLAPSSEFYSEDPETQDNPEMPRIRESLQPKPSPSADASRVASMHAPQPKNLMIMT